MSTESEKKKGRSFSLTDSELDRIEKRTSAQGFPDRNAYLLALLEADEAIGLSPQIVAQNRRVLRPEVSDSHILEQFVRVLRPERADRFARLWSSQLAALSTDKQEIGYTQAEAAGSLIETFLDGVEVGTIRPIENRAFAVLPAAPWEELLEAARNEDLTSIKRLLRKFDGSGLAAMYSFPEEAPRLIAEDSPNNGESSEAAEARRRAAALRAAADSKRGPTMKPKH